MIYRLTVDNITNALLAKKAAGVPIRIIVEPDEYLNRKWPEFWMTHANVDKLWAAGIPMKMRQHDGLTHMKVLITSTLATIASSNYAAAWQRDHNYFMPAIGQAGDLHRHQEPLPGDVDRHRPGSRTSGRRRRMRRRRRPAFGSATASTTPTLTWNRAMFATSYDVYLGTSPSAP